MTVDQLTSLLTLPESPTVNYRILPNEVWHQGAQDRLDDVRAQIVALERQRDELKKLMAHKPGSIYDEQFKDEVRKLARDFLAYLEGDCEGC